MRSYDGGVVALEGVGSGYTGVAWEGVPALGGVVCCAYIGGLVGVWISASANNDDSGVVSAYAPLPSP